MLRRTRSTFFLDDEADHQISHESNKRSDDYFTTVKNHLHITNNSSSSSSSSNKNSLDPVLGLRILIDHHHHHHHHHHHQSSHHKSNNIIVVKPTFRLGGSTSNTQTHHHRIPAASQESSFLKACCLCKKKLSPQKDVYMYRGDQGFCSVDCRCRQILIDEIKEMEASTKEILASSRHSPSNVWVGGVPAAGRRSDIPAAA
ncbi:Protein of unknown function DUF581 [Macleaya cordata]|uniref:FLZ-type domain-containing protein n=1 Tax=Macleaya cordata TaxID=56857 RepID=A0A200QRE8_MACCD|nr:Protein of unknown function DUF581 [Macleaya cordata]